MMRNSVVTDVHPVIEILANRAANGDKTRVQWVSYSEVIVWNNGNWNSRPAEWMNYEAKKPIQKV